MSAHIDMNRGADISECGRYRYRLWRTGLVDGDARSCLFVMLNPSTADADVDDPTIRKCAGFCRRWGYGMLTVVNLFGWRSTSPRGLLAATDPVGPDNDGFILGESASAARIVLAWGSHREVRDVVARRQLAVRGMLGPYQARTVCLGYAKDGSPRHPLMLAYSVAPELVW